MVLPNKNTFLRRMLKAYPDILPEQLEEAYQKQIDEIYKAGEAGMIGFGLLLGKKND